MCCHEGPTTAYLLKYFFASETEPLRFRKMGQAHLLGLVGASKFTFFCFFRFLLTLKTKHITQK